MGTICEGKYLFLTYHNYVGTEAEYSINTGNLIHQNGRDQVVVR